MRSTLVVVALAWSAPALANTYYVAPKGSDTAAGTQAAPWATLQKAADKVAPGDVVHVAAGSYAGFQLETSGKAGAEIAFVADAGVKINADNKETPDGINLEGASFVRIEGFDVSGRTRAGIRAVTCQHVTIRGNHTDDNGRWGIFTGFCDDLLIERNEASRSHAEHGIYVSNSGDRPVVRGNVLWGNIANGLHMNGDAEQSGDGIISNALVEDNVIYDNGEDGGSGINCDGVQKSTIRNNLLYGNHASGISLYRIDGGGPSTGNVVVNNTIVMAADARWAINVQDGSSGNRFLNNILLHGSSTRGAFDVCAGCTAGMVSDHNMGVGRFSLDDSAVTLAQWRSRTGQDANYLEATAAALFENGAGTKAADFALRAGSPAIDNGVATDAPGDDLAGNPRPQGAAVDVGALERCEGACKPPPDGTGGTGGSGGDDDTSGTVDGGCCRAGRGTAPSSALLLIAVVFAARRRRGAP
jgi:hypothetical protein